MINAGGVINNGLLLDPDYSREKVLFRCGRIGETLLLVFERADRDGITTAEAADLIAEERMSTLSGIKVAA